MILLPEQSAGALYPEYEGQYQQTLIEVLSAAAALANKYFIFSSSGVNYYAWFNLDAGGVDPAVASKTAVPVAVVTGDTAAQVATKAATAINALALVNATADGVRIQIMSDNKATVTDAGAGNSGFTVNTQSKGHPAVDQYPAAPVDGLTNTPSLIT